MEEVSSKTELLEWAQFGTHEGIGVGVLGDLRDRSFAETNEGRLSLLDKSRNST